MVVFIQETVSLMSYQNFKRLGYEVAVERGNRKMDCSQSRPGNKGFPLSISAKTHPTDQMSIARVYSLKVNITSGARYHLDINMSSLASKLPVIQMVLVVLRSSKQIACQKEREKKN